MDILEQILISPAALKRYSEWAAKTAFLLVPPFVKQEEDIGEEKAIPMPDGRLRISIEVRTSIGLQTFEFFFEPDEWAWHAS